MQTSLKTVAAATLMGVGMLSLPLQAEAGWGCGWGWGWGPGLVGFGALIVVASRHDRAPL